VYIKGYLQNEDISMLIPGVQALVVSKPVLYRNEKEEVGLMVKIDAFGSGEPGDKIKRPVHWLGTDKKLWKIENFAYFHRNELYQWQIGGWVY
jgi:hypothetical protein